MFTLGFTSGQGTLKDTAQNLLDSKECTISIISENFVDAANYTSLDSPANVSEWALCGLTPVESDIVKPPRVGESVFSVEAKVIHTHDWHAKSTGNKSGTLVIAEGVRFHVKEDALKNGVIDPEKLKAVGRLGGITYSRVETLFELPRPHWKIEKEREEVKEALAK